MDPNIGKSTDKERTVSPCKESLPTSCGPHRKCFLEVQSEIRAHMTSDKKTLLQEEVVSTKRNLMSVGGHADTPVDLIKSGNPDANAFFFETALPTATRSTGVCNGQTVLMRTLRVIVY